MKQEVFLDILSFQGYGGQHSYGKLSCFDGKEDKEYELSRKVTKEDLDGKHGDWEKYEIGDPTNRFNSDEEVIENAKAVWKKHFPECTVLVLGKGWVAEPQRVLCGPEGYKSRVNKMCEEIRELGGWEYEEKKMWKIVNEFTKLRKELGEA